MNRLPFDVPCVLFVPGNRPDRYSRAMSACSEGIVIDCEDAVPLGDKAQARQAVCSFLDDRVDPTPVYVRINPLQTRAGLEDLALLSDGLLKPDGLVLPKVESPRDIETVRMLDPQANRPILALIETAAGIDAAAAIALELGPYDGLAFGGVDLASDLRADFQWEALLFARSVLVNAAARRKVPLFDVPHLHLGHTDELVSHVHRANAMGFTGKLAIHPDQVQPIRDALTPKAEDVARSRRIVEASQNAGGDAFALDGKMVDEPVVSAARRLLERSSSQR